MTPHHLIAGRASARLDPAGCEPVLARLRAHAALTEQDEQAVGRLCQDARDLPARRSIIKEGDRPEQVHWLLRGWAARYKLLPDGARQIVGLLIPGDVSVLHASLVDEMDHGIVALGPVRLASIPAVAMDALAHSRPNVGQALLLASLVEEATAKAWILNVGRRDAAERIAHLFCELHARLERIGLVDGDSFELPLTQDTLADAVALTAVHVNRTLQHLRSDGLILLKGRRLKILDLAALRTRAGFDGDYLRQHGHSRPARAFLFEPA